MAVEEESEPGRELVDAEAAVDKRLEELREVARGQGNLLVPIRAALKERATLGEVCGVMREEFGEYSEA